MDLLDGIGEGLTLCPTDLNTLQSSKLYTCASSSDSFSDVCCTQLLLYHKAQLVRAMHCNKLHKDSMVLLQIHDCLHKLC